MSESVWTKKVENKYKIIKTDLTQSEGGSLTELPDGTADLPVKTTDETDGTSKLRIPKGGFSKVPTGAGSYAQLRKSMMVDKTNEDTKKASPRSPRGRKSMFNVPRGGEEERRLMEAAEGRLIEAERISNFEEILKACKNAEMSGVDGARITRAKQTAFWLKGVADMEAAKHKVNEHGTWRAMELREACEMARMAGVSSEWVEDCYDMLREKGAYDLSGGSEGGSDNATSEVSGFGSGSSIGDGSEGGESENLSGSESIAESGGF